MNQPSREHIEARITALLLGELPADEAELLRFTIAQDAVLKKRHDELASTIVLVREAAKTPEAAPGENPEALKLSEARRKKLLAHFQTPRQPEPLFWLKPIKIPNLVTALVCVALVALVAAMLLPALASAKKKAQKISAANVAKQKTLEMEYANSSVAAATLEEAPSVVTVSPPPVIAKPSVAIVLPSAEVAEQIHPVAGLPAAERKPAVMPQNTFGYVNQSLALADQSTAPQAEPRDEKSFTASLDGSVKTRLIEPQLGNVDLGISGDATAASASKSEAPKPVARGNFGLGAVVGGVVVANNSFADRERAMAGRRPDAVVNGANRSTLGGVAFGDRGGGGGGGAVLTWSGSSANNSPPASAPAGAVDAIVAFDDNGALPQLSDNSIAPTGAGGSSRVFKQRKLEAENSDQLLTSGLKSSPKQMDVSGSDLQQNEPAIAGNNFYRNPTQEAVKDKAPVLGDVPMLGRLFQSSAAAPAKPATAQAESSVTAGYSVSGKNFSMNLDDSQLVSKSGSSAFDLGVAKDSFKTGLSKNDAAGLRYAFAGEPLASPAPTMETEDGKKSGAKSVGGEISYQAANKQLTELKQKQALIVAKIEAEQLENNVPKSQMVQVIDPAEPQKKQTFFQSLKGEYASTARVIIETDVNDANAGNAPLPSQTMYDPYFVQTTFEIINSELVLGKVVDALKLDSAWSKKGGGEKLKKTEAMELLKSRLELQPVKNTKLISITAKSGDAKEAALIANAVAEAYKNYRSETRNRYAASGLEVLKSVAAEEAKKIQEVQAEVERLKNAEQLDQPLPKPAPNAPIPQPEVLCRENNFSTFSLNVSDVSFKLAAASLERGQMPDAASIRSEEFINAFDYRDPEAKAGQPLAFASERARYPFAQNRELLRFSVKTAAAGRPAGRALNLVLLLDNSGSMERADRVAIIRESLRVLATQLQPQDTVSVVTFARTARLWADGVSGDTAGAMLARIGGITPEGGTNLEEAMRLAYETARRHYLANGLNRVVLLTDGAANLGDVSAADLKQKVEAQRKQGIALDCFGIGFEDYNDDLLEQLSSHGDGRYAFLNSPEDASKEFAAKLAGALQIAAQDVKVQVEFNPQRVISYRQIGYAKHQLTKEQFRDNTVDAAEIAAQEAGNALYTVETKADGSGPVATVHVRYKIPGTTDYRERSWDVAYTGNAVALEQSSAAMRLAATASAFSEWLTSSPFAQEVTPDELLKTLSGVPQIYGADERPKKLEWMIRQAKSLSGK